MKILYIASERSDAQAAAAALCDIAPDVTLLWAARYEHVADWIHENRDLAALVVDAQIDGRNGTSLPAEVRNLGLTIPLILIAPEETAHQLESLEAGAYDVIAKNDSLFVNLPVVTARAIDRAQRARGSPRGNGDETLQPLDGAHQRTREELVRQEGVARADLERELAEARASLQEAEQRHRSAMATAAEQLAGCQARYETSVARAAATWGMVEEQVREAAIEVDRARKSQASAAVEVDRLSRRESLLASQLAEVAASHRDLKGQLADAKAALEATDARAARERVAAAEQAEARRTEFQAQLEREVERRQQVEKELARAVAAGDDAAGRHAAAMTAAAAEFAERQRRFEADVAAAIAARDGLEQRLSAAEVAVEEARRDHASATAELARRARLEAELTSQLADAAATRTTLASQLADAAAARTNLEHRLNEAAAATTDVEERAARDRDAATARQADLETRLAAEIEKRETVERELAQTRSAASDAARGFLDDAARLADQVARERLERESRLAQTQEQLRTLALERDALDESLGTMREQSQRLDTEHREERERLERGRLAAEAAGHRLENELADARQDLDEARLNFQQTLARVSNEHATAQAALAAAVSERDGLLEEQAARQLAALQAAARERAELQDGFQATAAAQQDEIERLHGQIETTIHELDVTRSLAEILQIEAGRVPKLQEQLEASRVELRRQFEDSPQALCRCTGGGTLTHANRAFAALTGYRHAEDLRSLEFATTVFEVPDDLSWLVERCLSTRAAETIETTWRRRNGKHLVVRLTAFASSPDTIEIVAEDLTNLHAVQKRLDRAHRMEAVGRLASEVAITCGNLLGHVHQDAQQWLTTVDGHTALRRQGEILLDEVRRAAGFLRQLAAYSDDETRALAPVDLNRVLRDLEPVLKRVAGDDVELELPQASSPLDVDVKAERVERLLVNLASYGRTRMPSGGRLRIELATVVVDRRFIAKYPNVRQGPHALITVTEIGRAMRADEAPQRGDEAAEPTSDSLAYDRPGLDLGALQGLIRECSGHLWMAVERPGDMVVKIHLPLDDSNGRPHARTSGVRSRGGRTLARWFQP